MIFVIDSEEKDGSLILQENRLFFVLWIYAFFILSYPGAVLGFLSVIGLTEKLYKTLYTLSVVFSEILAGTPSLSIKAHTTSIILGGVSVLVLSFYNDEYEIMTSTYKNVKKC